MASFAAIKTGVKLGKDMQSLGKDLGKLFTAIDDAKNTHAQASKGKGSGQEKALETYIAAVQARDLEAQLRDIIIDARGFKGWNELQAIRAMVMKTEREGKYKAIQRYNKIMNIVGIGIAVLITVLGALGMVWFIREYS
jgi:geranylgeranyl pyrophosphate synthase